MTVTSMAPAQVVPAPARQPLPFGLFSVVPLRGDGDRWFNGVTWMGESCEPARGIGSWNCLPAEDEGATVGLPKDLDGGMSDGEGSQFTVYGVFQCSPMGWSPAEAQEFANRHLINREEARVEQALWTGDLGNIPNFAGTNGVDAPTELTAGDTLTVIASLEDWLATNYGSLGVLHMSRGTALLAVKKAAVEARGGRLFTALGTPVVAGAGYPTGRVVASGAMFAYRSEVMDSSARPGDLLDRSSNDLFAVAERTYVLGVDDCGLAAADIDIPEPVEA